LTNFTVTVSPDSGPWSGAKYLFTIQIPPLYPHEPPKVTCRTKIYHPNINLEGNVCLNILREEWKPVLDINAVIYGMIYLFYEPNPDDPLNREAADLYRNDKNQVGSKDCSLSFCAPVSRVCFRSVLTAYMYAQFVRVVKRTLQGYSHNGEAFEKLI
jgi:ubiquitin-protein ligase